MIHHVLTNPAYAGLFVYGRRVQQARPGDPLLLRSHRRPLEEWEIVVPDVYPPYVSETQYLANREILQANQYNFVKKRRGAPRDGPGLLAGLVVCGRCGRRMTVSYGGEHHVYQCRREQMTYAEPGCQYFPTSYVDPAVRDAFFAAIQPAQLQVLLGALDALERQRQALDRQWQLKLERARYAARLAERQYDACDPDNRLVAGALEKRWNDALSALQEVERAYAAAGRIDLAPLTATEQQALQQLAGDLQALWEAPTTSMADRKRLLRLAIQEVTVTVQSTKPRSAQLTILWSGGLTTGQTVTCRPTGWHCTTSSAVVERLRELAQRLPDHMVAGQLNAEGIRTQTGKPWTYARVASIRKQHQIPTTCPVDTAERTVRGDGLLPVRSAAERLGVSLSLIHVWIQHGVLTSDQRTSLSKRWVRLTEADVIRLDGQHDWHRFSTINRVMSNEQWTRELVWAAVRAGTYVAYRHRAGRHTEWRLRRRRQTQ